MEGTHIHRTPFENGIVPRSGAKSELHKDNAKHFYFQLVEIDHHTNSSFLPSTHGSFWLFNAEIFLLYHSQFNVDCQRRGFGLFLQNAGFLHKSTGKKTVQWKQLETLPSSPSDLNLSTKCAEERRSTRSGKRKDKKGSRAVLLNAQRPLLPT